MGKHTPGPWTAQERHPAGVHWDTVIRGANRDPIATVLAAGWAAPEHAANAALIAAAPMLLEALTLLWEEINDPSRRSDSGALVLSTPAMEQARAALAAAGPKEGGK